MENIKNRWATSLVETMKIIVDGYNLIRQSESLFSFEMQSLEDGRRELVRRLALFKRARGHRITVVFDGWERGARTEQRYVENGITIIYSRRGEKADEVITRMVAKGEAGCIVVTSDRRIVETITRRGALAIPSPEFEAKINMVEMNDLRDGENDLPADDRTSRHPGGKKKGPSRRLPRNKRRSVARLKKL